MRFRSLFPFALLAVPFLAGCGNDPLPALMAGGYVRDVTYPDGNHRLRLDVTPTGMTITGGPPPQTVPLGSPTAGSVTVGASGSALFKKLDCFNDYSCKFTTENGCDGSLTRDSSAALVLVATQACESWSGKWIAEKDAPPASSATAAATAEPSGTATAGPAALPTAPGSATAAPTSTASANPSATPSASGTATAGIPTTLPTTLPTSLPTSLPTASPKVDCLATCNAANVTCVRECKVGDLDCMKKCSGTMVTCATKCP